MLETLRKGAATWIAKIFIALLVLSFAVWGIADIFGGFGERNVATVGDTKISSEEYRQAYENQISSLSARFGRRLTAQQAQQLGIDQQVLSSLIGAAALDQQAGELKLGITDKAIAENIQNDPSFRGLDGEFSRTRFTEILRMNGLSEQGYIYRQREAEIRNQIVNGLFSSIKLPKVYLDTSNSFSEEKRVLKYFVLTEAKAGKIPAPDDAALRTYFDENKRTFTAPEFRKVGLLIVQPEKIKKTVKVDEAAVKAAYDEAPERFNEPEKRRVQQIAFADEEKAKKAHGELKRGRSFEAVAEANGFSKTEIDLGVIASSVLADKKIREAAFALKKGKFSDPVKGELATVLLKVTEIKPAQTKTFNDVKAKIRDEMTLEQAQNLVQDLLDQIEDERAGGAILSEVADKLKLEYQTIDSLDRTGNDAAGKPVKNIQQTAAVTRTAFESDVGVETEAIEIGDGGYQWVEVLEVTPEKLKDFENVKADVRKKYIEAEKASALKKLAKKLVQRLRDGEDMRKVARSVGLGVKTSKSLKRSENDGDLAATIVRQAFTLPKDGFGFGGGAKKGTRVVFQVAELQKPAPPKPEDAERISAQLSQGLLADMLAQFVGGLQQHYGVQVNENVFKRLTGRDQS